MKKGCGLLIGLIITIQCFSQSSAENYNKLGVIKLNQGYGIEAISFFNNAIKQNPEYGPAYINRAKAKLIISEANEALNDINKALAIDKTNPEIYYIRANIYNSLSENVKALADIDQAIKLKPDYNEALADKIIIQYGQNKDDKIFEILDKEIKKKPSCYLYYARGILFNITGKNGKALSDFTKSLSIDSTFNTFDIYLNKSYSLLQTGKSDDALAEINKAIKLKPGQAKGYFLRGQIYYDSREYKKALGDFETVLKTIPGDSFATFNSGMCYIKLEDVNKACECFRSACKNGNENGCKMSVIHCSKKK
jgi:tetratricopeptide (TPR) repeat protein